MPWGNVYELFGPVPPFQLFDGKRRQQRGLRPALPVEIRPGGGKAPGSVYAGGGDGRGELHPEFQGYVHDRSYSRAAGCGSYQPEDRRQSQIRLLCVGGDKCL